MHRINIAVLSLIHSFVNTDSCSKLRSFFRQGNSLGHSLSAQPTSQGCCRRDKMEWDPHRSCFKLLEERQYICQIRVCWFSYKYLYLNYFEVWGEYIYSSELLIISHWAPYGWKRHTVIIDKTCQNKRKGEGGNGTGGGCDLSSSL